MASIEPTSMLRMDEAEAREWARDTKDEGKDPYEMATDDVDPDTGEMEEWIVVRTGAVSRKREDFLFRTRPNGAAFPVSRDLFQQFAAAHQNNPLWANKNGEPGDLQKRLMGGKPIPVFFIFDAKDKKRIQAFGLAYMFRVPYRHSLHKAIGFSRTSTTMIRVALIFAKLFLASFMTVIKTTPAAFALASDSVLRSPPKPGHTRGLVWTWC